MDDMVTLEGLPKEAFADSARRVFPINTKERVYISNAYLQDKKAELEDTLGKDYVSDLENSIKFAAEVFGIYEDLVDFEKTANEKKSSAYEQKYLAEFEMEGHPVKLYPIKTAADLTNSAESFARNTIKYPFDLRVKIAENIIKFAREFGVDEVPDLVMKYAGMFYPDTEKIATEVWRRSTKLKKEANIQVYQDVIDKVLPHTESITDVMKVAEILYTVENEEGLYDNHKVASVLGDPVDRLFALPVEKVAEKLAFVEVHGDKYKISDLQKVAKEKYEEAFGFEIDPSDSEKLADILPTMPRSDMQLFKEITGVKAI